ncbi:MAG: hypothetical protein R2848_01740 [Thermomicrobiales bacterium]
MKLREHGGVDQVGRSETLAKHISRLAQAIRRACVPLRNRYPGQPRQAKRHTCLAAEIVPNRDALAQKTPRSCGIALLQRRRRETDQRPPNVLPVPDTPKERDTGFVVDRCGGHIAAGQGNVAERVQDDAAPHASSTAVNC